MTTLKIWYVLVPLFALIEFVIGYFSLGREPAKHWYVKRHDRPSKKREEKEITTAQIAGWVAFTFTVLAAYLFILESGKTMMDFAINFIVFDDGFDRSIAAAFVALGLAIVYGIALYAINRGGLSLHMTIIQRKQAKSESDTATSATSCSSVRYVETTPVQPEEDDSNIDYSPEGFDRVMKVFKDAHARICEIGKPQTQYSPAREHLCEVFGISAD